MEAFGHYIHMGRRLACTVGIPREHAYCNTVRFIGEKEVPTF